MKNHKRIGVGGKKGKIDLLPIALLSPTIFVVLIVMIIPLIYGLFMSLFDYGIGAKITSEDFIGFSNYIRLFKDATLWKSVKNTLIFTVVATSGDIILGTIIAVLLLRVSKTLSRFTRAIYTMPLLISPIVNNNTDSFYIVDWELFGVGDSNWDCGSLIGSIYFSWIINCYGEEARHNSFHFKDRQIINKLVKIFMWIDSLHV